MSKTIHLVPPDGVTAASFAGVEYPVEHGVCEVPTEAALILYGFGFGNATAEQIETAAKAASTETATETSAERRAREKAEAAAKAGE